ncbi:hypothetical protein HDE_00535 [Halotydeus destructor]|nr:hypothetical protein HDE_00535 [Halotydeus destructor]
MSDNGFTRVRQLVEAKCEQFSFEERELDMVFKDSWFVERFMNDNNGDPKKAAAAILNALVYRAKYKVYNLRAQDLPMEMFAWMTKSGRDIYGQKMYWANLGCHMKIPELVDAILKVDYLDLRSRFERHEVFDLYADLRGLTLQSIDMRLSRKSSSLTTTCFPGMVNHMFIIGLPVTLTSVIQAMVNMLPARFSGKITFLTLDQAKARVSHMEYAESPKAQILSKFYSNKTYLRPELTRSSNCSHAHKGSRINFSTYFKPDYLVSYH